MKYATRLRTKSGWWIPICAGALAWLFLCAPAAWAVAVGDGNINCPPPSVAVRKKITFSNDRGATANDFHFYMYQTDRPEVEVDGAVAACNNFADGDATLDSWNNHPMAARRVPPGVGPPYHGAWVNFSNGTVPANGSITVEMMLCMNEKNCIKITDIEWTDGGAPLPGPPAPAGGFRVGRPFPGGQGGVLPSVDPGGAGRGAQEDDGGGDGPHIHIVCIENDSDTNWMRVTELKLLASMTYYANLDDIDWDSIDPIRTDDNEPPILIPPLSSWCYQFETMGSYLGGHVYLWYDAEAVPPAKDGEAGGKVITLGDHPNPDLSPDADMDGIGDTLWDAWEEIYGIDPEDDGSINPDNGPAGDPDMDLFTNAQEQELGSDPQDARDPFAITPGYCVLDTSAAPTIPLQWNFEGNPVPPGFFGPGSAPFEGVVPLKGMPLIGTPCGDLDAPLLLGHSNPTALQGVPGTAMLHTEIVGLNLVSTAPIEIFNGLEFRCTHSRSRSRLRWFRPNPI